MLDLMIEWIAKWAVLAWLVFVGCASLTAGVLQVIA